MIPRAFRNILRSAPLAAALAAFCLLAGCGPRSAPMPGPSDAPLGEVREPADVSPLVHTVRTQVGKPYVWGGRSPYTGFDCSGLVWWAFRQYHVSVPRFSLDQYQGGTPVSRRQLRPGDVVFFKIYSGSKSLHMGVYTERGTFVHAPSKGGVVREEPFDSPYWRAHYIGARRYL